MADNPYPETGLSQETRDNMYPDNYSDKYDKVFKQFVDGIIKPNLNYNEFIHPDADQIPQPVRPVDRLDNHEILLDELTIMYDAHMTIGGQQNRFNASVIRAAINVIKAL